MTANLSGRSMARALGWSHARYGRFETSQGASMSIQEVAEVAAVLGLELSARLYRVEDAIRDAAQQPLRTRFLKLLAPSFKAVSEVLFPHLGDTRSWDLLLRLGGQLIGVELETRVRDVQLLVRRIRDRERDGGADHVLVVLSASRHNRQLLLQLLEALGVGFATPPRELLRALREGGPLPGSGVVLL